MRTPPTCETAKPRTLTTATIACALLVIATISCSHEVNHSRWQHMTPSEKTLYVSSLLGAEQVKHSKGGTGFVYSKRAEDYVARIDEAYSRGDNREPAVIFAGLADNR